MQGLTPLMYACLQGDEGMVQILLQNGAKPDVVVSNMDKSGGSEEGNGEGYRGGRSFCRVNCFIPRPISECNRIPWPA